MSGHLSEKLVRTQEQETGILVFCSAEGFGKKIAYNEESGSKLTGDPCGMVFNYC